MFIVLTVIAVLIIMAFSISFVGFKMCFYNKEKNRKLDPYYFPKEIVDKTSGEKISEAIFELIQEPYERVETTSYDGLRLRGNFYKFYKDAPVFIFFHGYRSGMYSDFCGMYKFIKDVKVNVLLVSERSHWISQGKVITFGIREKYDVLSWVNYVIEKCGKDTEIILGGISMGATSVLMSTSLNLPNNVKMISADCGYDTPEEVIKIHIKQMKMPVWFFYPFLVLGAKIYGGFNVKTKSLEEILKNNKIPTIIFHGEADNIVPYSTGKKLFESIRCEKQLVSFPTATHGLSYLQNPVRYKREYFGFLRRAKIFYKPIKSANNN